MTPRTSPDPAGTANPRNRPAVESCTARPAPVADVQGTPAAASEHPKALAVAGPGVPAATEASAPAAAEASRCPAVPGEGERGTGTKPLSGKDFRDAFKAAQSAKAKAQRQQRARPWSKRDRYRDAVPGGRKPPPGGESR